MSNRKLDVTEQDLLAALAAEIAPPELQKDEFLLTEIISAVKGKVTRTAVINRLNALVAQQVLSSRKAYFAGPTGRREQWAYRVLKPKALGSLTKALLQPNAK